MADGDEENPFQRNKFPLWQPRTSRRRDGDEGEVDEGPNEGPVGPDLGLGRPPGRENRGAGGQDPPPHQEINAPKREDNASFSFKHFLQSDNATSTGARPKVYESSSRFDISGENSFRSQRLVNTPELASVLPDFVQDHLVIEQCYLADSATLDIDNLPDFALNSSLDQPDNHLQGHLPCDLGQGANLNLPCDLGQRGGVEVISTPTASTENPSVNQALPDFLSDGPIHSDREAEGLPEPPKAREEGQPYRSELERTRRQLTEQTRRVESLEQELQRCRQVAQSREEMLRRATIRSSTAEDQAAKQRHEIKQIMSEMAVLRRENQALREGGGASGGAAAGGSSSQTDPQLRTQRVARELMQAATQAEMSLRQLLSGVEGLRLLASSLDQGPLPSSRSHRRPTSPSPQDYDPEDQAGPAL